MAHPKPPKKRAKPREPGQLRRPTSAYFFFLNTFREAFKVGCQRPLLQGDNDILFCKGTLGMHHH